MTSRITFNPVIGISGKARHGKDTVTDMIVDTVRGMLWVGPRWHLMDVRRIGFADAVKAEAKAQGWNGEKDVAGRSLLQKIGSDRRAEHMEYWVVACYKTIVKEDQQNVLWVITDVRYKNEADYIREVGGVVWRVNRINLEGGPFVSGLTPEQLVHPSEVDLDNYTNFDAIIINRRLTKTRDRVQDLVNDLIHKVR